MNSVSTFKSLSIFPHHIKQSICGSRAKYREGRRDTAVKVYTINQESVYLLITNVPAVGGGEELQALCEQYGIVDSFKPIDDYPTEEFTEAYLVKYSSFPSARSAKRQLDDKSFLGSILHMFYAPEFETVSETRLKLQERRKYVAWKMNTGKKRQNNSDLKQNLGPKASSSVCDQQPTTYIWAGKEYTVHPPLPSAEVNVKTVDKISNSGMFIPRQCKNTNIGQSSMSNSNYNQYSTSSVLQKSVGGEDISYQQTISQVRSKISSVSVPNMRVSLKRKKRL